jgi:peptidoglycan hydrolase-like protein with peptidoglycan-binding domain
MILGFLTLITALTISAVAIYYSVAGLVAIFAASAVPIIIMGSALEIGKLVTAIWLHKYWKQSVWWLKTYLTIAVVVLMFITSMGIFGFLSKAHIDQTASARESVARIEQIEQQILSEETIVNRAEQRILQLEQQGSSQDDQIQQQIDREQARIDSAYTRIQPGIDEQNRIIDREQARIDERVRELQEQVASIDQRIADLDAALADNQIRTAQALVGTNPDGDFGPGTERAINAFRDQQQTARNQILTQIDSVRNATNSVADSARTEIQRLRAIAESEINSSNELIARLRTQLGSVDTEVQSQLITEQRTIIRDTRERIDTLTQQRFELESEYRRLEAEVGPVKYLAEFIYGDTADRDLLEDAVRWVIVIIIFVFDPLAVLLLIASQYTFEFHRKNKSAETSAQHKKEIKHEFFNEPVPSRSIDSEPKTTITTSNATALDPDREIEEHDSLPRTGHERGSLDDRQRELEELEEILEWKDAKHQWKVENPDKTIKQFKEAYIKGDIDQLPWEGYVKTGYRQNEEQGSSGIWSRIRKTNND